MRYYTDVIICAVLPILSYNTQHLCFSHMQSLIRIALCFKFKTSSCSAQCSCQRTRRTPCWRGSRGPTSSWRRWSRETSSASAGRRSVAMRRPEKLSRTTRRRWAVRASRYTHTHTPLKVERAFLWNFLLAGSMLSAGSEADSLKLFLGDSIVIHSGLKGILSCAVTR